VRELERTRLADDLDAPQKLSNRVKRVYQQSLDRFGRSTESSSCGLA